MALTPPRMSGKLGKMAPKAGPGQYGALGYLPKRVKLDETGSDTGEAEMHFTNSRNHDAQTDNPGSGSKVSLGNTPGISHARPKATNG